MCAGGYPPYRNSWSATTKSQGTKPKKEEERPRWEIRCKANGRDLVLETAYPLPSVHAHAARILALEDLRLERLFVVFPGKDRFRLHERVEALPLPEVPSLTLR